MKPLRFAIPIAILALPLCASDDKDQAKPKATGTTLTAPASPQQDSPLVRAAKATGRLNKKPAMVITNETLAKTGGHFTTSTQTTPLPPAPPPSAAPAGTPDRSEEIQKQKAEAAKKDAAAKNQKLQRANADYYGESIEPKSEDPAVQEHDMETATKSQKPAKPPEY